MAAAIDNDYNLIDGATVNVTPGPNTLAGPAGLVSDLQPRLAAGSPAIDAADTAMLGLGVIFHGLPLTDADGLRRIKNTGENSADVGAFESGDASFLHAATPGTISSHITWIDNAATNAQPDADLIVTPNFNGDGSNPDDDAVIGSVKKSEGTDPVDPGVVGRRSGVGDGTGAAA
jgi:hypothetical protein